MLDSPFVSWFLTCFKNTLFHIKAYENYANGIFFTAGVSWYYKLYIN
ncbi:hypothetical protein HMPREF3192_01386 [Atopobium deltae]|uniref:Uncharacterized protein n=1 Tax=Atopobium deltae TaxID=1393034 RepID=A0A133XQ01_9ACTN|nr:hypothetical protein HMPREF3192_01386 [Atopobium deltae]